MRPRLRRVPAVLAVLAAALVGPLAVGPVSGGPAYGAVDTGGASIDHAETGEGTVRLLVSVPGEETVDLGSVAVRIGGRDAEAEAEDAARSDEVVRTAVLAIDSSNSMRGRRIVEARKAALAYLDAVPANVRVGVIGFADDVVELLAPTTDRAAARRAVAGIELSRATSLYDGVLAAVNAAGDSGLREVLLLSDGKDTTDTDLDAVLERIRGSGVSVDAVSLEQSDRDNPALRRIVEAGKGEILAAADPSVLVAAYAQEARVLARQVLVVARVPAGQRRDDAEVRVSLRAGGRTYTGAAFVKVQRSSTSATPPGEPAGSTGSTPAIGRPVVLVAVAAIGVALLTILVLLFGGARQRPPTLAEQIGSYGLTGRRPTRRVRSEGLSLTAQATQAAARALASNRDLEAGIERRLDAAGMALKPAEWVLAHAGLALGAGVLGALLGAGNPVAILIGLLIGALGPWLYLGIRRSRRLAAFEDHLADTLQLMSGSLSAGLSLAQSLDTIVREGSEPVCTEFRRVIVESRLGVGIEDALEGVATRMQSKDFGWVVMAIRIQREVGGNLAELLLTVAATLREREYLRRYVRTLSAEGRLSCWILGALPPVFLVYLVLTRPDYVIPMFTTPLGWLLCVTMTVLVAVGIVWMAKAAKVEI